MNMDSMGKLGRYTGGASTAGGLGKHSKFPLKQRPLTNCSLGANQLQPQQEFKITKEDISASHLAGESSWKSTRG